jgi:hypothetical protein
MPTMRVKEITRLVRYTERLGFHRVVLERAITKDEPVYLYRHVGAFGVLNSLAALPQE